MTEADEKITQSIYWQMLRELEAHLDDTDAVLKLLIESAYRHLAKMAAPHLAPNLVPDHVWRNGGKWLTP